MGLETNRYLLIKWDHGEIIVSDCKKDKLLQDPANLHWSRAIHAAKTFVADC